MCRVVVVFKILWHDTEVEWQADTGWARVWQYEMLLDFVVDDKLNDSRLMDFM